MILSQATNWQQCYKYLKRSTVMGCRLKGWKTARLPDNVMMCRARE